MALTGKTISQLTYLQYPTNDTLIPVELSGDTFHIAFSAINYTELTYADLATGSQAGELSPGQYYLISDYQTCYDQPNFDSNGGVITTGNYKTGPTEPLLLLATSTTGFSPTAFSTLYPQDKITYDFTWNLTEVTGNPAKGRITERIDQKNNRTDYDFRAVQFIRYEGFFSEVYRDGKVSIDSLGQVTGIGTTFTLLSPGQIVGIYYGAFNAPISCFVYYEVTQVNSNTDMTVSGTTILPFSNTYYSIGLSLPNYMSPFPPNVTGYSGSAEYYTFNDYAQCSNNYLGNNTDFGTFLLSNNVFLNGPYSENYFLGNVQGNTFNDAMYGINAGTYFGYNIITNTFRRNMIGDNFEYNIIDCDMELNDIGGQFVYNMFGDDDGNDFDFNTVGSRFRGNFLTQSNNDFISNRIGDYFENNIIDSGFRDNNIQGDFYQNLIRSNTFNDNVIGATFSYNIIPVNFDRNTIGPGFSTNNIYSTFQDNQIAGNTSTNFFGDPNSIGASSFVQNTIGANMLNNYFSGTTQGNVIGNNFDNNNINYNFSYNRIGDGFQYNTIDHDFGFGGGTFRGNVVGNGFQNNTVYEYCYDNVFGDSCTFNSLGTGFTNNRISNGFNNVTTTNLDSPGDTFANNTFLVQSFSANLTLSGGTGGNPNFYSLYPCTVTLDRDDATNYITFLSAGTYVAQTIIV